MITWADTHPRKWVAWAKNWAPQSWISTRRRQTPLTGWKTAATDRRLWEAWTLLVKSACAPAYPQAGCRVFCPSCCQLSCDHLTTSPSLSKQTLCSLHITAWHWIWGSHDWGQDSTVGCRGDLVPGQSLSWAVVAIVSRYSNSASEAAQISDSSHSTTGRPWYMLSPCRHCLPWPVFPPQGGGVGWGRGWEQ